VDGRASEEEKVDKEEAERRKGKGVESLRDTPTVLGDGVSEGWRGMRKVDKEAHWPGGTSCKGCRTPSFGRKEVVLLEGALVGAKEECS
jgi:hypothetical protein